MSDADHLSWRDGDVPISVAYDDAYFAWSDGAAETQTVFVAGNNLPARLSTAGRVRVAELGFGTGLNCAVTVAAWRTARATHADRGDGASLPSVTYTSFEIAPLSESAMQRSLRRWPGRVDHLAPLFMNWPPESDRLSVSLTDGFDVDIVIGDAAATLASWDGVADCWYLDGFSPAKNADLWSAELMKTVFAHTAPGGSFSTYTAAGWVRRNLQAAGFEVERVPGFDRKRERLQGMRPL
ncbi:MAG: tRNA (5-methylaminomethyl-2-thiouridine)(34)-methyltransferase MnmD [Pseudomonadota bacterium]